MGHGFPFRRFQSVDRPSAGDRNDTPGERFGSLVRDRARGGYRLLGSGPDEPAEADRDRDEVQVSRIGVCLSTWTTGVPAVVQHAEVADERLEPRGGSPSQRRARVRSQDVGSRSTSSDLRGRRSRSTARDDGDAGRERTASSDSHVQDRHRPRALEGSVCTCLEAPSGRENTRRGGDGQATHRATG